MADNFLERKREEYERKKQQQAKSVLRFPIYKREK